jgi:hypothetical protein
MRILGRIALALAVLTIVYRDQVTYVAYAFAPIELGTDALVIGSPTTPRPIWCEAPPDQVLFTDVTRIFTPSGSVHANDHGQFFTWIYFGVRIGTSPASSDPTSGGTRSAHSWTRTPPAPSA